MAKVLSSFKLFPKFPPEIQVNIWTYVCHFPQILVLRSVCCAYLLHPGCLIPPAVFHTSHLARQVALRIYEPVDDDLHGRFYFNHVADTVYFHGAHFRTYGNFNFPKTKTPVRSLALDLKRYMNDQGRVRIAEILDTLKHFPKLEEVKMIIACPREIFSMSFTEFHPAQNTERWWKEDLGKMQVEKFLGQVQGLDFNDIGQDTAEELDAADYKLPNVSFEVVVRQQDWKARDKRFKAVLRKERKWYNTSVWRRSDSGGVWQQMD